MKEILLKLVAEIEDLRAIQAVIAQRVGQGTSYADARDAKTLAIQANAVFYETLRKEIEALS